MSQDQDKDALDRVLQLRDEIDSHRARLAALAQELPPDKAAAVLVAEVCDTIMPLFSDFAAAVAENMSDEREFLMEEIVPVIDDLADEDEDDPDAPGEEADESQLTVQDGAEYTALLSHYHALLQAQHDAVESESTKQELASWIGRVLTALQRTLAITVTPPPEETETAPEAP